MGYTGHQESDTLALAIMVGVIIMVLLFFLRKKGSAPPASKRSVADAAPGIAQGQAAPARQGGQTGQGAAQTGQGAAQPAGQGAAYQPNPGRALPGGPEGGGPAPAVPIMGMVGATADRAGMEAFATRQAAPVKGIFVVVTAGEAQVQMVAMSLATQVLVKGKFVRVLLCGPAGDIGLKGGKEIPVKPLNVSPNALLKGLIGKGAKVEICPFYLATKGITPADMVDGITPAAPAAVADALLEPGVKLFTF